MAHHIGHIRKKMPPRFDRHGGYLEAMRDLANETGCDPHSAFEEWWDRVEARLYSGTVDVDQAEADALEDVRERYRRAS